MRIIYRHALSLRVVELQDLAPKEEFDRLRREGYEQIKLIPETPEDEDIVGGLPYPETEFS